MGRGLRDRWEGAERLVPVCVVLRLGQLVQVGRYGEAAGLLPADVVSEALGMWTRRAQIWHERAVVADAVALRARAGAWDPIGELVALDDWQAAARDYSPREIVPMRLTCPPIETIPGSAITEATRRRRQLRARDERDAWAIVHGALADALGDRR